MKSLSIKEDEDQNGTRIPASTSLEEHCMERVERVAKRDQRSVAAIIRKCVLLSLPELEREVLGAEFVGGIKRKSKASV